MNKGNHILSKREKAAREASEGNKNKKENITKQRNMKYTYEKAATVESEGSRIVLNE